MQSIAEALAGLASPALRDLPAAEWWTPEEWRRIWKEAEEQGQKENRGTALEQLKRFSVQRFLQPIDPHALDRDLCQMAERRAAWMLDQVAALCAPVTRDWLSSQVEALEARPLPELDCKAGPVAEQLAGLVKRVTCAAWWRRQIRRAATRKREAQAQARGVIRSRGQAYCTDETVARRAAQQARAKAMLEQTEMESADGEVITLWQAVQASTANLAIRRGELMTRIRGAEEWATACGMVGLFTTNTLPSRFHSQLFKGGQNPAWDGSTPADGQRWLCKIWARTRAALQRQGLRMFGFRVAEPHHDSCPHWHMLLWVDKQHLQALQDTMRAYWLSEEREEALRRQRTMRCWGCKGKGSPQWQPLFLNLSLFDGGLNLDAVEHGAEQYRLKFEAIDPAKGGAVSYVAKYIAKNIDDAGAVGEEGHRDELGGQMELIEGTNKAKRVMAWAAAHGIRQFQAIGQPPVTVWRELRRVDEPAAQGASQAIKAAHVAVNREGGRRACWRAYLDAQGGAMTGRDYRVRMVTETQEREGRYGTTVRDWPIGVADALRAVEVVPSNRKAWRPKGTWTAEQRRPGAELREFMRAGFGRTETRANSCNGGSMKAEAAMRRAPGAAGAAVHPWTRVNNCTGRQGGDLSRMGLAALWNTGPGGSTEGIDPCLKSGPPSRLPIPTTPAPKRPAS